MDSHLRIYNKNDYTFYEVVFTSLSDLYDYLLSNENINSDIFDFAASKSKLNDESGLPFDDQIKYLVSNYTEEYSEYIKLKREIDKYFPIKGESRAVKKCVSGSRPNVPNYIAGTPKAMYRLERKNEYKQITVNFNLASVVNTNRFQIYNRGILTLNLIKILEDNNYIVRFNTFLLVHTSDEIIYIKVNLKNVNEAFNEKKCFFPLCSREFLRRDIFRVIETLPVKNKAWQMYGDVFSESETKRLLRLSNNDIFINHPKDIGITGTDVEKDIDAFLDKIKIKKYFKSSNINNSNKRV